MSPGRESCAHEIPLASANPAKYDGVIGYDFRGRLLFVVHVELDDHLDRTLVGTPSWLHAAVVA